MSLTSAGQPPGPVDDAAVARRRRAPRTGRTAPRRTSDGPASRRSPRDARGDGTRTLRDRRAAPHADGALPAERRLADAERGEQARARRSRRRRPRPGDGAPEPRPPPAAAAGPGSARAPAGWPGRPAGHRWPLERRRGRPTCPGWPAAAQSRAGSTAVDERPPGRPDRGTRRTGGRAARRPSTTRPPTGWDPPVAGPKRRSRPVPSSFANGTPGVRRSRRRSHRHPPQHPRQPYRGTRQTCSVTTALTWRRLGHATSAGVPAVMPDQFGVRGRERPPAGCRRRPRPRRTPPARCRPACGPAWDGPSGATPPMAWPVCWRTNSGVARRTSCADDRPATLAVSTRCAPDVRTSRASPSASKMSELAIWPTSLQCRRGRDGGVDGVGQDADQTGLAVGVLRARGVERLLHRLCVGVKLHVPILADESSRATATVARSREPDP